MAFKYVEIPLEELTTPREGYIVMLDRWWVTRNGNPVVAELGRGFTVPQCTRNQETAVKIAERLRLDSPIFVPVAYFLFKN